MKRSLILVPLLVGAVAVALLVFGGGGREYTTASGEAYASFQEGYQHYIAMQIAAAESALTRAVAADGDFAMARALLAANYARQGRKEDVDLQAHLADSLAALLPNDVERVKVQIQLATLKEGEAAKLDSLVGYLRAEEPDNVDVLYIQASILHAQRDPEARGVLRRIVELEPNYAPAYNLLGYLDARDGDYEAALANLQKYAYLAPDLANPHDSLGEILGYMGEYEQAEREYARALTIDPDFHFSLLGLANVYLEQGMLEKGRGILEKLRGVVAGSRIELQIDQLEIRTAYTWGDEAGSLALMRAYVAKHPDDFLTGFYDALMLVLDGDQPAGDVALAAFMEKARERVGKTGDARAIRRIEAMPLQYDALAASVAGDHFTAAEAWAAFAASYDDEEVAPHELWWVRWREGRERLMAAQPRRALELAMMVLESNPNRIPALLLAAEAALHLDERTMARQALNQAAPLLARADAGLPAQQRARDLQARLDASAS